MGRGWGQKEGGWGVGDGVHSCLPNHGFGAIDRGLYVKVHQSSQCSSSVLPLPARENILVKPQNLGVKQDPRQDLLRLLQSV